MNKRADTTALLLLIIIVAGIGFYLYYYQPAIFDSLCLKIPLSLSCNNVTNYIKNDTTNNQIICTQEAKQCPDGSYVGRDSNNHCEFKQCPTITPPNLEKKLYIYFASKPSAGLDDITLRKIGEDWKAYIKEASYGRINNIEFIYEANADITNPKNIDPSRFGKDVKTAYFITGDELLTDADYSYYSKFNSGIDWNSYTFAFAWYKAKFPVAVTNVISGWKYTGSCQFSGTYQGMPSYMDICRTNSHELAHAIFMCDDNTGDIMRPTDQYPYTGHFPPSCLSKIDFFLPKFLA